MTRLILFLVSGMLLLSSCKDNQLKVIENCADERHVSEELTKYFKSHKFFHDGLINPVEAKVYKIQKESKVLLDGGFTEKEVNDYIKEQLKFIKDDLNKMQERYLGLRHGTEEYRRELINFIKKDSVHKINNDNQYLNKFKSCEIGSKNSQLTYDQRYKKSTYMESIKIVDKEVSDTLIRYKFLGFEAEKMTAKSVKNFIVTPDFLNKK